MGVFKCLKSKLHDVANCTNMKIDAAINNQSEKAKSIKSGAVKITATLITAVILMPTITGCTMFQFEVPGVSSTPPHLRGNSDSGLFDGERYNEEDLPVIKHRTEEEIEQTGLTAQDVLNAYDQLCLDIAKQMYLHESFEELSEDAYNNMAVCFNKITPFCYYQDDPETGALIQHTSPFYAINPYQNFQQYWQPRNRNYYSAYPITIYYETYIDGVKFSSTLTNASVEPSEFENLLKVMNLQGYELSEDILNNKVLHIDRYSEFVGQQGYDAFEISRDFIFNATPEVLEALYKMINSLRSIQLEQKLPDVASSR